MGWPGPCSRPSTTWPSGAWPNVVFLRFKKPRLWPKAARGFREAGKQALHGDRPRGAVVLGWKASPLEDFAGLDTHNLVISPLGTDKRLQQPSFRDSCVAFAQFGLPPPNKDPASPFERCRTQWWSRWWWRTGLPTSRLPPTGLHYIRPPVLQAATASKLALGRVFLFCSNRSAALRSPRSTAPMKRYVTSTFLAHARGNENGCCILVYKKRRCWDPGFTLAVPTVAENLLVVIDTHNDHNAWGSPAPTTPATGLCPCCESPVPGTRRIFFVRKPLGLLFERISGPTKVTCFKGKQPASNRPGLHLNIFQLFRAIMKQRWLLNNYFPSVFVHYYVSCSAPGLFLFGRWPCHGRCP